MFSKRIAADTSNRDFGDPAGDAYFQLKDMYLPYACEACKNTTHGCHSASTFDCNNPESNGNLVVRKVQVEVNLPFVEYELCNVKPDSCDYSCRTLDGTIPLGVGSQPVCAGGGVKKPYVCYKNKCYPYGRGYENQTSCEATCGKTAPSLLEQSLSQLELERDSLMAAPQCTMAYGIPSAAKGSQLWDFW